MNLPCQFQYGIRSRGAPVFVVFFGIITAWLAIKAVHCQPAGEFMGLIPLSPAGVEIYHWMRTGLLGAACLLCATLALASLINLVSNLIHPRILELTEDALVLPCGYMQLKTCRIPYVEIQRMEEPLTGGRNSLRIVTANRTMEISRLLLHGSRNFSTVRDFLMTKVPPVETKPSAPSWTLFSREEFIQRVSIGDSQLRRRWHLSPGIHYAVITATVPAMAGLVLLEGVLWFSSLHPEVRYGLQLPLLGGFVFCALLYLIARRVERRCRSQFTQVAVRCPGCNKHLMFYYGQEVLKTGCCPHCRQPVIQQAT